MPVKIRCYNCGQMLNVGRSKAGGVVSCTNCAKELAVPGLDAFDLADFGRSELTGEPNRSAQARGGSATAVAQPIEAEPAAKRPQTRPASATATVAPEAFPAVDVGDGPIVMPPIRVENALKQSVSKAKGSAPLLSTNRDLIIPRSLVSLWSMLVLASLMFAFLTGLLAGHFIWRVH